MLEAYLRSVSRWYETEQEAEAKDPGLYTKLSDTYPPRKDNTSDIYSGA